MNPEANSATSIQRARESRRLASARDAELLASEPIADDDFDGLAAYAASLGTDLS